MDLTQLLPTETIEAVLDLVTFPDILSVSRISHRWRTIARNHPLFWRKVHINAASDSALACFSARISKKPDCTVAVVVDLRDKTSVGVLDEVVLPLISRNLPRIDSLTLKFHRDAGESVYKHLSANSAPELTSSVIYSCGGPSLDPIPINLFSGYAPRLLMLSIRGAFPPTVEWPHTFSSVKELAMRYDPLIYSFRPAYLRPLSSLRVLRILDAFTHPVEDLGPDDEEVISRLVAIECLRNRSVDEFWLWPPLTRVPVIRIDHSTPSTAIALASHITGDLWVFVYTLREVNYRLASLVFQSTNRKGPQRQFGLYEWALTPCFHWTFCLPEISSRIVYLMLEPNILIRGRYNIAPLYRCKTLELFLDSTDPELFPITGLPYLGPEELPCLGTFKIVSDQKIPLSVDADTIRSLIQPWLPLGEKSELSFQLSMITITGDVSDLPPMEIHGRSCQDFMLYPV